MKSSQQAVFRVLFAAGEDLFYDDSDVKDDDTWQA